MKVSVVDLVFDAPRLLEWLGWSVTKRPHLLGTDHSLPCLPFLAQALVFSATVAHSGDWCSMSALKMPYLRLHDLRRASMLSLYAVSCKVADCCMPSEARRCR